MKQYSIILAALAISLSLSACSKESAVEKATGGAVKIDKDGGINVKDKDGNEVKIGKAKWDAEKMFGLEAPKASIDSYATSKDGTSYTFSDMKDQDIDAYIKKLKDAGYTYNYMSIDEFNYTGTNKDGITVSFTYSRDSNSGMIIAAQGEKPAGEGTGTIIEGDNAKWESAKIGGLPDPGVKVTSYTSTGNGVTYTFESLTDAKAYVEKIKQAGFTAEATEVISADGAIYSAKNGSGDEIYFMSSSDGCSVSYTKAN